MNVHTRIRKTLDHEEPDRVPILVQTFEWPFIMKAYSSLGWKKILMLAKPYYQLNTAKILGIDAVWFHFGRFKIPHKEKPEVPYEIKKKFGLQDAKINDWAQAFTYRKKGTSWYMDGVLKTPELIREWISYMKLWEPGEDFHFKRLKKIWDKYIKKRLLPIPTGGAVSYGTWSTIGINRFAYMTRKHLNLVKKLAKVLGKITKEFQTKLFEFGIDMAFVCDDWAFKGSIIFNPKQWDEIIGPVYADIAKNAHKYDSKFLVHTDGNITECIPYIVKSGADAIEPLEYESGARLKPIKEQFGDKITLIGNVPATFALTFGTKDEVISMTKQCIKDAAIGGGYILGAGSDILGTCKLENVKIMIETAKKYGKYPLVPKSL
ncbi:MAG: uroporphyrinogen decarboxylase family protein [Promethearchaeota archaeon]